MFKEFLETFKKPTAKQLAERELYDAERNLLLAQSCVEHAQAQVMYRTNQVRRLTAFLAK